MDKRYNPVIFSRLQSYARSEDWQGMLAYLHGLSHSAFRTAGYVLAEKVLPALDADNYWACFHHVALTDTKAFLMTFLKAALQKYGNGGFGFADNRFLDFAHSTASQAVSLDRHKSLKAILPVLHTPAEVEGLLSAFCNDNSERKANYLAIAGESMPCYYALFQTMRKIDYSTEKLESILMQIIRRSTPLAYNFVSITQAYFDIGKPKGFYSLTLQPYELSGMESGFDSFAKMMNKIR